MERQGPTIINPEGIVLASGECTKCGVDVSQTHSVYEVDRDDPKILIRIGLFCDPCREKPINGDIIDEAL